jgi:hypothetical protein
MSETFFDTKQTLLEVAMPSIASSAQIFASAPAGTTEIWMTIRTAGLTMRTDAGTATAGANGVDFVHASTSPYVLQMDQTRALLCRAIQNGGTTTGYIVYRG